MRKKDFFEEKNFKRLIYVFSIVLIISIIAFASIFFMYNKKLKEDSNKSLLELGKLNDIVSNEELEEFAQTSSSTDKNVNEAKEENDSQKKQISKNENLVKNESIQKEANKKENNEELKENIVEDVTKNEEEVEKKELEFIAPVSGEILKDFALDTLIYSNTLEEWTTHSGIDIQSEKTSIVVAAESGTVEGIKTDPRYGLTIIISHTEGFKTIYSNLLTTEFVEEGQVVEKGQTIATIGESSSFEIADEAHLHFEMYKDGNCVNPTIYLK